MDFILVENKKNKRRNKNTSDNIENQVNVLTKEDITNNINLHELFEHYKPFSVILFGTCINCKIKSTNEIDIIMLWKKNQPNEDVFLKI